MTKKTNAGNASHRLGRLYLFDALTVLATAEIVLVDCGVTKSPPFVIHVARATLNDLPPAVTTRTRCDARSSSAAQHSAYRQHPQISNLFMRGSSVRSSSDATSYG